MAVTLKEMAEVKGESTMGGKVKLQSGSKIIPVEIGNSRSRQSVPKFSHQNLKNLGSRLNLSNNSLM